MEPEPLIARIVPCPECGRQNRIPAHSTTAHALCSACHAPLGTAHSEPAQATHPLDPTSDSVPALPIPEELVELPRPRGSNLDRYDSVLWLHDVPNHPLCHRIDWSPGTREETSEIWLEVQKPTLTAPPPVPVSLMPWVDSEKVKDSASTPTLRERIPAGVSESREGEDSPFILLNARREITASWVRYLEDRWKPWAEKDRALRPVQRVYNSLFSIYQKQKKLGEAFDVVLGLGLLQWTTPSNHEIRRHLVTAQASVTFDAERGVLSVGPAGEGANLRLEQDMLDPQYRPAASEQASAERRLQGAWG
jgi:hypothetical protein